MVQAESTQRAWHEAGHALAAHLLGGRVREVSLESERDDLEGHVAVEWRSTGEADEARRFAAVALAGPVAELIFRGEDVLEDTGALEAWRDDWNEADAQLERLHAGPERREEREDARRTILRELHGNFGTTHHYESLARLADALEAHVTLDDVLFLDALGER